MFTTEYIGVIGIDCAGVLVLVSIGVAVVVTGTVIEFTGIAWIGIEVFSYSTLFSYY